MITSYQKIKTYRYFKLMNLANVPSGILVALSSTTELKKNNLWSKWYSLLGDSNKPYFYLSLITMSSLGIFLLLFLVLYFSEYHRCSWTTNVRVPVSSLLFDSTKQRLVLIGLQVTQHRTIKLCLLHSAQPNNWADLTR